MTTGTFKSTNFFTQWFVYGDITINKNRASITYKGSYNYNKTIVFEGKWNDDVSATMNQKDGNQSLTIRMNKDMSSGMYTSINPADIGIFTLKDSVNNDNYSHP